jgi:gamma-glutamylcyclotransferase (GGCT)/AIG2-like uncharacterized protein YtfP
MGMMMKQKAIDTVFVYGTLKQGYTNHYFLEDSLYLGEFKTNPKWGLLDLGLFPAMVVGSLEVEGEAYGVSEETLDRLDRLEGVEQGLYRRKRISVNDSLGNSISAWAYIYNAIPHNETTLVGEW